MAGSKAGQAIEKVLSELSGNLEKAIIEIVDMRQMGQKKPGTGAVAVEEPVSARGAAQSSALSSSLKVSNTFAGMDGLISEIESMDLGKAGDSLIDGIIGDKENPGVLPGATQKIFHVQFNPSELTFSGFGGGLASKTDFSEGNKQGGKGITFESMKVRIAMNVKLIFDQVDPQDAFMADKFNTAPTAIATGVTKLALKAAGKKENSVQKEVEGFIAALRSAYTRRITFAWGDMCYTGILNRVSSQYTMFNVTGDPVRAVVMLSLVCADEEISESSMGSWKESFDNAFASSRSYVKAAQKVGNLLNFNL